MSKDEELKKLWREMYELTEPRCAKDCNAPRTCCSAEYCEMAIQRAKDVWGEELVRTGHPTLPMMGPQGCIAPPHTRVLCTVHICEGTLAKLGITEPGWSRRYWKLREQIGELEYERHGLS